MARLLFTRLARRNLVTVVWILRHSRIRLGRLFLGYNFFYGREKQPALPQSGRQAEWPVQNAGVTAALQRYRGVLNSYLSSEF